MLADQYYRSAMKTLSLKVHHALDAKLAALAKQHGTTKSAVVREAVEAYARGNGGLAAASAFSLAKDLAGCVSGPMDLSVNKEYLRDFGGKKRKK